MKATKAYLIDPVKLDVTEVIINGDYTEIYKHIDCEIFTAVEVNKHGDTIYIDDEGLFVPDQVFFMHSGYPHQPLAGKGLLLGTDEEGESVNPHCSLEETIKAVSFLTRYQVLLWLKDHPNA